MQGLRCFMPADGTPPGLRELVQGGLRDFGAHLAGRRYRIEAGGKVIRYATTRPPLVIRCALAAVGFRWRRIL